MFDCTTCVVGIFKCFWILSSNSRTVFVPGIFQGLLRRILSHFFKYWPTGKSPRLIVISCTINYFPFSEGFIFRHAQLREASLFWGYVVNVSSAAIAFYYSVEITDGRNFRKVRPPTRNFSVTWGFLRIEGRSLQIYASFFICGLFFEYDPPNWVHTHYLK